MLFAAFSSQAKATPYNFQFSGAGVSGNVTLTYGTTTDSTQPQGYEITGVSGTFTDTNYGLNIVNATITGLEGLNRFPPEQGNMLAPNDFSRFGKLAGLPAEAGGYIHYDNLFYPAGSPQTATDYPFYGGFLDIYGVLFDIGNGQVVNFWSNGVPRGAPGVVYGVAVMNHTDALDYVNAVQVQTPEPGTLFLLGTGLVAAVSRRRMLRKA